MARYDYQCQDCNEVFEAEHAMTSTAPVTCPTCEGTNTRKIFLTGPGVYFNWWNAKASSEATLPKYLAPVRRKAKAREEDKDGSNDRVRKKPRTARDDGYAHV